jgi:hypothetical protein
MSRFSTMDAAIRHNQQFICEVSGCGLHRKGISSYCARHRQIHDRYGHPLQAKLRRSRHAVERELVKELVLTNGNHAGVIAATRWIQSWIDEAVTSNSGLAAEDFRRLSDHGVAALDILIEAAAFYVFSDWNRRYFLNDASVDIGLSLAVLGLAPMEKKTAWDRDGQQKLAYKRVKAGPRKHVGKRLKAHLLDFFINVKLTLEANKDVVLTTREALRSPLAYPPKLIPHHDTRTQ